MTHPAPLCPSTLDALQHAVTSSRPGRLRIRGAGTKAGGGDTPGVQRLDTRALRGITSYNPAECVLTALGGTPVAEIEAALAAHAQYLPFDPTHVRAGGTIGGTVASGLSGSGRYRYGGVRDFVIGARLVDGHGRLITSGGQVVKNAAGFLTHHALVGSAGRFGVIGEVTFKVFPRAEARATVRARANSFAGAAAAHERLRGARMDLEALDLELDADGGGATVWARLAGAADALPARIARARDALGLAADALGDDDDRRVWSDAAEFLWAAGDDDARAATAPRMPIVKVPTTPSRMLDVVRTLAGFGRCRVQCGGAVALLAAARPLDEVHAALAGRGWRAVVIQGALRRGPARQRRARRLRRTRAAHARPGSALPLTSRHAAPHSRQRPGRAGPAHGAGRVGVRALRLLPAGVSHLPRAGRRDGFAAWPHRAHEGSARRRIAPRGGRAASRPLPLVPGLRDGVPVGGAVSRSDRALSRAARHGPPLVVAPAAAGASAGARITGDLPPCRLCRRGRPAPGAGAAGLPPHDAGPASGTAPRARRDTPAHARDRRASRTCGADHRLRAERVAPGNHRRRGARARRERRGGRRAARSGVLRRAGPARRRRGAGRRAGGCPSRPLPRRCRRGGHDGRGLRVVDERPPRPRCTRARPARIPRPAGTDRPAAAAGSHARGLPGRLPSGPRPADHERAPAPAAGGRTVGVGADRRERHLLRLGRTLQPRATGPGRRAGRHRRRPRSRRPMPRS